MLICSCKHSSLQAFQFFADTIILFRKYNLGKEPMTEPENIENRVTAVETDNETLREIVLGALQIAAQNTSAIATLTADVRSLERLFAEYAERSERDRLALVGMQTEVRRAIELFLERDRNDDNN